jgi:hypothetical protein
MPSTAEGVSWVNVAYKVRPDIQTFDRGVVAMVHRNMNTSYMGFDIQPHVAMGLDCGVFPTDFATLRARMLFLD